MKFGIRKPSVKKSLSARTTGKAKRKLKRLTNPFYGKKGMGFINNPKKALYNKAYNKTSISAKKSSKAFSGCLFAPFYYFFYFFKLLLILSFYMIKYFCILLWWLCVLLINGIISLVEFVINLNAEDANETDSFTETSDT